MSAGTSESVPGAASIHRALSVVLVAFALGALVLGAAMWVHGSLTRRAIFQRVEVPLSLEAGARATADFHSTGRYRLQLWLVLSRHAGVPHDQIDLALAGDTNGPPDISWEVFREAQRCAAGCSTNLVPAFFGAQEDRGRLLGEFKPPGSGRYRVSLQVDRVPPGLAAARPVVRISAPPSQVKSVGVAATVYQTLGLILFSLGALLACIYLLSARRRL